MNKITKEELIKHVDSNSAYKGQNHKNKMLLRAIEIIKEQDSKIYNLQAALGMIPKGELHE